MSMLDELFRDGVSTAQIIWSNGMKVEYVNTMGAKRHGLF